MTHSITCTSSRHDRFLTLPLLLSVLLLSPIAAQEPARSDLWRFLPNHGNSIYDIGALLHTWPEGGPEQLWQADVGWGKSAVVEAQGKAFTATEIDQQQYAICLDAHTGRVVWKHLLLPNANRHFAWGPSTSPVIDDDRVYFIPYATYENDVWEMRCPIYCFQLDGTLLWRHAEEVWATEASTPLVQGEVLYVGADNPQRAVLVALDKRSGDRLWSTVCASDSKRELAAPASLTYQEVGNVPQIVVGTYGTRELLGIHARTGDIMWRYPYPADIRIGLVSTPVAVGSRLFVCAGEGKGKDFSALLQMRATDGKVSVRELYRSVDLQNNMYNTVAICDDAVFGFGGNDRAGFLHCTNLDDGRLLWKDSGRQWTCEQNLVIADGLLFAVNKSNELVLAEASRKGYRELSRFKIPIELGRPQQPTIANGRMYLRGKQSVVCYQVGTTSK